MNVLSVLIIYSGEGVYSFVDAAMNVLSVLIIYSGEGEAKRQEETHANMSTTWEYFIVGPLHIVKLGIVRRRQSCDCTIDILLVSRRCPYCLRAWRFSFTSKI